MTYTKIWHGMENSPKWPENSPTEVAKCVVIRKVDLLWIQWNLCFRDFMCMGPFQNSRGSLSTYSQDHTFCGYFNHVQLRTQSYSAPTFPPPQCPVWHVALEWPWHVWKAGKKLSWEFIHFSLGKFLYVVFSHFLA